MSPSRNSFRAATFLYSEQYQSRLAELRAQEVSQEQILREFLLNKETEVCACIYASNICAQGVLQDEPKWTAHYRGSETDGNPHRLGYLNSVQRVAPIGA